MYCTWAGWFAQRRVPESAQQQIDNNSRSALGWKGRLCDFTTSNKSTHHLKIYTTLRINRTIRLKSHLADVRAPSALLKHERNGSQPNQDPEAAEVRAKLIKSLGADGVTPNKGADGRIRSGILMHNAAACFAKDFRLAMSILYHRPKFIGIGNEVYVELDDEEAVTDQVVDGKIGGGTWWCRWGIRWTRDSFGFTSASRERYSGLLNGADYCGELVPVVKRRRGVCLVKAFCGKIVQAYVLRVQNARFSWPICTTCGKPLRVAALETTTFGDFVLVFRRAGSKRILCKDQTWRWWMPSCVLTCLLLARWSRPMAATAASPLPSSVAALACTRDQYVCESMAAGGSFARSAQLEQGRRCLTRHLRSPVPHTNRGPLSGFELEWARWCPCCYCAAGCCPRRRRKWNDDSQHWKTQRAPRLPKS